jgi:carbonic anhydrase/acetyltransferase-like protein (isoleucine patch superfamily)
MIIKSFNGKSPKIHESVYISENVSIIGDVEIGENSSIWFGTVIRGDVCNIKIGKNSNVQDNAVIHVNYDLPSILGDFVTVGHSAVIHGAVIGDFVLVGMGAIVLDNVKVGRNVIIAAGSVVPPRMEIPDGVMVMGVPAKIVRALREEEIEHIKKNALDYVELAKVNLNPCV